MPLHKDFSKVKRALEKQYGKEKGETVYYKWLQKHGYDDSKPLSEQKSKATAEDILDILDPDEGETFDELSKADANHIPHPPDAPHEKMEEKLASKNKPSISIPAYKFTYVAQPESDAKNSAIIIKAVVLEEGKNVNNWRVLPEEFTSVAKQYEAGRHLRVNHGKDVQDVIGKSFAGKVLRGAELQTYLGHKIDGISDIEQYVVAEFKATPQDAQVRTNILQGYVDTGSIGLDANAFCEACGEPLKVVNSEYQKTCPHLESGINLKNVEVKEYSYVAEPAFEHTIALPSFSAAVTDVFKNSSLTYKPQETVVEMSAKVEDNKISATAKKAEGEGEGETNAMSLAKAYADSEYKRGLAEGRLAALEKFHADDAEPDEDEKKKTAKKASVEANMQTDQVAKITSETKSEPSKTDEMMARILRPTSIGMDAAMKELFKAAAEHPTAPNDIRQKFKGRFD